MTSAIMKEKKTLSDMRYFIVFLFFHIAWNAYAMPFSLHVIETRDIYAAEQKNKKQKYS